MQIGAQLVLGERDDICELKGAGVYRRDARVGLQGYRRDMRLVNFNGE